MLVRISFHLPPYIVYQVTLMNTLRLNISFKNTISQILYIRDLKKIIFLKIMFLIIFFFIFMYAFNFKCSSVAYLGRPAYTYCSIVHSLTPRRILKYPFSPQSSLKEFVTSQYFVPFSTPQPIILTVWRPHQSFVVRT